MKKTIIAAALLSVAASAQITQTGNYDFNGNVNNTAAGATVTNAFTGNQAATVTYPSAGILQVATSVPGGLFGGTSYGYTAGDWIAKIRFAAVTNTNMTFVQFDNSGTGVSVIGSGGNYAFGFGNGGTGVQFASTVPVVLNQFVDISVINYGGTMRYMINGNEVGSQSVVNGKDLGAMMLSFGQGGNGAQGTTQYDRLQVYKFNSATTTLAQVQAVAVPEPSVALLGGLGALALLRRRRA